MSRMITAWIAYRERFIVVQTSTVNNLNVTHDGLRLARRKLADMVRPISLHLNPLLLNVLTGVRTLLSISGCYDTQEGKAYNERLFSTVNQSFLSPTERCASYLGR